MAIPSGVWRYTYIGNLAGGEQWQSSIWWAGNAPTSNSSAQVAADLEMSIEQGTTASSWFGAIKSALPSTVTLERVNVQVYATSSGSPTYSGQSTGTHVVGGLANSGLPNQCSVVVSLLTGLAGRSHRGRMYLPIGSGTTIFSPGSGQINSAYLTTLLTAMKAMIQDNQAVGQTAVVVSPKLASFEAITAIRADTRVDVQRRRANRQLVNSAVVMDV